MSLFRCPSRFSGYTCDGSRWHQGWHHATWTWWPLDRNAPAERRTTEWDDVGSKVEGVIGPIADLNAASWGIKTVSEVHDPFPSTLTQFADQFTRKQAETDAHGVTAATAAENLRKMAEFGVKVGDLYDQPTPLMKAHLALIAYGRHQPYCDQPETWPGDRHGAMPSCTCGFNRVLRETCPAPEGKH